MAFTAAEEARIRKVTAEASVREVIDRYFHCVDSSDWDLLATCFTDDASFEFNPTSTEKNLLNGGNAIVDFFRDRNLVPRTKIHFVGHAHVVVAGNSAKADVFAISNIVVKQRIAVRGLRYQDELVMGVDGEWRFKSRLHRPLWQYLVPLAES